MAKFTSSVPLNINWLGNEINGAAGATHRIPDALYDEFNRAYSGVIPDLAWVTQDETTTFGVLPIGQTDVTGLTAALAAKAALAGATFTGAVGAPSIGTVIHADQYSSVNAAVDALPATGGEVYIPAGTYAISQSIVLRDLVTLRGAGLGVTVLQLSANANTDVIQGENFSILTGTNTSTPVGNAGSVRWTLRDMTISGNKQNNSSGYGIRVYGDSFYILNVRVQDCANDGIYSEWSTDGSVANSDTLMESQLVNVSVIQNNGCGIRWRGPHDSQFVNILAALSGSSGIAIEATSAYLGSMQVSNIHSYGNTADGITVATGGIYGTGMVGESNGRHGIVVRTNDNVLSALIASNNSSTGLILGGAANFISGKVYNNKIQFDVSSSGGLNFVHLLGYAGDSTKSHINGSFLTSDSIIYHGDGSPSTNVAYHAAFNPKTRVTGVPTVNISIAAATVDTTLTTAMADLPGAFVTATPDIAETWHVRGVIDFNCTTAPSGNVLGQIVVGSTTAPARAFFALSSGAIGRQTVPVEAVVDVAAGAATTAKLQANRDGAGGVTAGFTYTTISVTRVAQ